MHQKIKDYIFFRFISDTHLDMYMDMDITQVDEFLRYEKLYCDCVEYLTPAFINLIKYHTINKLMLYATFNNFKKYHLKILKKLLGDIPIESDSFFTTHINHKTIKNDDIWIKMKIYTSLTNDYLGKMLIEKIKVLNMVEEPRIFSHSVLDDNFDYIISTLILGNTEEILQWIDEQEYK